MHLQILKYVMIDTIPLFLIIYYIELALKCVEC